jgi:hypothetical protein
MLRAPLMRIKFVRLISICVITIAASCSLYNDYEASRPAHVMELESRLVQAGFRRVPIETPEQNGAVAELPLHRLNRYQSADGSVFWYADPTVCQCLYEGDQKAYERYAGLLEQEHDTAEYINDERPAQVASLSPFGYAFPPPVIIGGWPVTIHGGGVTSKGGGGGGVHSRGGGNGGGVHRHH